MTLARRLSFDLTGLPPTVEEVESFVNDSSPDAYEKVVDRLLASPHYGERMAMYWLDMVRYADTNGYHGDNHRDIALYRDYVIDAFNQNKPFDRFTIEQLAGDLLPDASRETRIASGYNHLLMTTREGGAQAKEYLAKYAADRVRNASTVWLGATMGCAECHDHKFDPLLDEGLLQLRGLLRRPERGRRRPARTSADARVERGRGAGSIRSADRRPAPDPRHPDARVGRGAGRMGKVGCRASSRRGPRSSRRARSPPAAQR